MPYTITVQRELTDQFLMDVMTTMVESGYSAVHYWTVVNKVHRVDNQDLDSYLSVFEIDLVNPNTGRVVTITMERAAQAIQAILADRALCQVGYPADYIVSAVNDMDAGDIDATAADCIAQVAVLGVVEYG